MFDQFGPSGVGFDRRHGRTLLRGNRRDQSGFTAGAGAKVKPASAVGTGHWREGQCPRHQLAALVLNQCHTVPDRSQPTGITAAEVDRIGRIATDLTADGRSKLRSADRTGPGSEMNHRSRIVGGQRRVEFAGIGAEGVGESLRDPARMGMGEGGMPDGIGVGGRRQFSQPRLLVALGDGAQHTVDETCSDRIEFESGLLDCGRHRGVRGNVGAQQLIGA